MSGYLRRLAGRDAGAAAAPRPRVASASPIRELDQRPEVDGFEAIQRVITELPEEVSEAEEPMAEEGGGAEASGTLQRKIAPAVGRPGAPAPTVAPDAAPPTGPRPAAAATAAGRVAGLARSGAGAVGPAPSGPAASSPLPAAAALPAPGRGAEAPPPPHAAESVARPLPTNAAPALPTPAVSSPETRRPDPAVPPAAAPAPQAPSPPRRDTAPAAAPLLAAPDPGTRSPAAGPPGPERVREIHHHTVERLVREEGGTPGEASGGGALRRPASAESVSQIGPLAVNRRSNLRFALRQR